MQWRKFKRLPKPKPLTKTERRQQEKYEVRHCGCKAYPNCEDWPLGCAVYNPNYDQEWADKD